MTCTAKHTKYQPPMSAWKCPKCGVGAQVGNEDGFIIQDSADGASGDCALNHDDDQLGCNQCGYGCSGAAFARRLAKAANMVSCEHCKGSGMVKAEVKP